MTGNREERAGLTPRSALLLLMGLGLAGCGGLGGDGAGDDGPPPSGSARAEVAAADAEAPDVFQVTEAGLWDGRPSLGGVWVAHPDVTDPERVRIVNQASGQQVVGALFRRERDLPGPALQVSSDAAEALGMLAGAPAELQVTALRRQEEPPAPGSEPAAEGEAAAAAAEPEANEEPPQVADAEPAPPAEPVDPAAAEAVARATAAILEGAEVAPAAAQGAIATTTLDSAPAAEAPAPAASALDRPFVQLGTFGSRENADAVAERIGAQGLPVAVVPAGDSWRLLLGPATTEAQRSALLQGAVAAGFADAYLVSS